MTETDRPGNTAMKARWEQLNAFWKEKKRGPYDLDFTEWCVKNGLLNRTARESYWARGIILGIIRKVFDKNGIFWEYCNSSQEAAEAKPPAKISKKAEEFFEKCRIKEKMLAGPCAYGCEIKTEKDPDCRNCTVFFNLKDKEWLEEAE
jgi:hypothetical protein